MSLLAARGLSCGYGERAVLSGVDFNAEAGDKIALLGPNGSGKSTFLKTLLGLLPPLSGEVLFSGDSLTTLSERDLARRIASTPQEEAHLFGFSAKEIVAMGRLAASEGFFDSEEDLAQAEKALKRADASSLAGRSVTELSGGERQRVLIARALCQDAPILAFDEPTAHLDIAHQLSCARLFAELGEEGKLVLAAIHDLNLAGRFASRGMLFAEGRLLLDLPMQVLLASPTLDEVFEVRFERSTDSYGRLNLIPG